MDYETKVKLYIDGAPAEWVACAIVCLYDRDRISRDDRLGMDITDVYGEATFRFSADDLLDVDDRIGGQLPELYIQVVDSNGDCVLTTRATAERNTVPNLIRVAIDRDLAVEHGLI
ncbi:MAG TPA: hypothetical protein VFI91_03630 [Longimicrobiaceae bacterium]|nr:hypothetical protein [Longimicrobiaceae bacterium]